jgi:hypothetical protein
MTFFTAFSGNVIELISVMQGYTYRLIQLTELPQNWAKLPSELTFIPTTIGMKIKFA